MRFRPHSLSTRLLIYKFRENYCSRRFVGTKSYKVLFFGSDSIALSSVKKINELKKTDTIIQTLKLVTANNSKHYSVIEKYAKGENIEVLNWPLKNIEYAEYDIGLVVAFGHMISKDILSQFPLGMVNVHPSLLPRWRGAAPIIHALKHGDQVTGVSLMKIKPDKFDVGEIIDQVQVPVPDDIKLPELTEQLSELGSDMLVKCMRTLPQSLENAKPQSEEGITYAKKINKSISAVRWAEMSAVEVYNLYRAIFGVYPLSTKFRDKQVKLFDAFLDKNDIVEDFNSKIGELEYCDKKSAIQVLCKDKKRIYFKSIRIVGKRKISAIDFYNGYIKNVTVDPINSKKSANK